MKSDQSGEVRPAVLNCDTALGQALIAMFVSLERELIAENALPGALKVIVFGGGGRGSSLHQSSGVDGH
ncbi:hypothetical protein [Pseudomonas sp. Bc-h]|uniref:hypothetical protein n=1 Tax=Pseudomonas sp. Bc-h TaxID=1943632 RepID=UPI001E486CB4|nr:hypothetical protein [Pseudomonas sp. Bc-h]